jgi:hypothetical protein
VNLTTELIYLSGDYVFDGVDFSLGIGANIYNPGGSAKNITVRNCKCGFPSSTTKGLERVCGW